MAGMSTLALAKAATEILKLLADKKVKKSIAIFIIFMPSDQ